MIQLWARLRRIVTCIWPNQKNQPHLDLYLVRRYKICHISLVLSNLSIGQNQKNRPNLDLYLIGDTKSLYRSQPWLWEEVRCSVTQIWANWIAVLQCSLLNGPTVLSIKAFRISMRKPDPLKSVCPNPHFLESLKDVWLRTLNLNLTLKMYEKRQVRKFVEVGIWPCYPLCKTSLHVNLNKVIRPGRISNYRASCQ